MKKNASLVAESDKIASFLAGVVARAGAERVDKETFYSLNVRYSDDVAAAVERMVKALYARQTADEQTSQDTRYHNGVGFTGADARRMSFYATYERKWSPWMVYEAARRIKKYAGQLAEIRLAQGQAKAAQEAAAPAVASAPVATNDRPAYQPSLPIREKVSDGRTSYGSPTTKNSKNFFGAPVTVRRATQPRKSKEAAAKFWDDQEAAFDAMVARDFPQSQMSTVS